MGKPGRMKQAVIAIHQIRNRVGVTKSALELYLREKCGETSPGEWMEAVDNAVLEGFLEFKNNKLFPKPSELPPVTAMAPTLTASRRRRRSRGRRHSRRRRRGRMHENGEDPIEEARRRRSRHSRSHRRRRRGRRHYDMEGEIVESRRRRRSRSNRRKRRHGRRRDEDKHEIRVEGVFGDKVNGDNPNNQQSQN